MGSDAACRIFDRSIDVKLPLHGVDLVEPARLSAMIERHGERLLGRVFTEAERAYCEANARRRAEHYAGRFAAKEAVLKAIGTGWRAGIAWTDVAVTRSAGGAPGLRLCGEALRIADDLGVVSWRLSISHTPTMAMASVIGVGANIMAVSEDP